MVVPLADGSAGRTWLTSLCQSGVWEVTSAEEVVTFRQLRRLAEKRRKGEEWTLISSTWLNVAFTLRGLEALLGASPAGILDGDLSIERFRDARFSRVSGGPPDDVHALLVVAA